MPGTFSPRAFILKDGSIRRWSNGLKRCTFNEIMSNAPKGNRYVIARRRGEVLVLPGDPREYFSRLMIALGRDHQRRPVPVPEPCATFPTSDAAIAFAVMRVL